MSDSVRVGVLVSGRGSNFEALALAATAGTMGAGVVCLASDDPAAPALRLAARHGIPTHVVDPGSRRAHLVPAAEEELGRFLGQHEVDLVCLAGFMRIIGRTMLAAFPGAILNIHPSLLPSFPGLEAQRQALAHGVKVSGCTVHLVDDGVDAGPIVLQAAVPVLEDDTAETLAARILEREHEIYPQAVGLWAAGRLRLEGRRVRIATTSGSRPGISSVT